MQTQQMTLPQIAPTKAHLRVWKGRGGGGTGLELLLGSPAWGLPHEKVQHHLLSEIGKTFSALLPAGQGTPPPQVCWQWHPRESTKTAGPQGSGSTEHPLAVLQDRAPP